MEGILYPVCATLLAALILLIARQFNIRTKLSVRVEKQDERLCKVEETQPLTLEGMYMLLSVAKKKGEINGESDGLMRRFEDHLFNRK